MKINTIYVKCNCRYIFVNNLETYEYLKPKVQIYTSFIFKNLIFLKMSRIKLSVTNTVSKFSK